MLILEGPQGAMKSTACRILAGEEHFSDNLPDLSRGDAVRLSMHLRGKWLVEIAELSSFNKAETHTLKEFITQAVERYTPKYGREEVREPRQCVFVGTTNESVYLRDPTGARRFWPVTVSTIDLEALAQDRDQLLAEAMHEFRAGAQWWPDREFEAEHIAPQQEARYEADPWQEVIETYLRVQQTERISAIDVLRLALGLETPRIGTPEQRRVKNDNASTWMGAIEDKLRALLRQAPKC
jgi:predicted P-loop ATPase